MEGSLKGIRMRKWGRWVSEIRIPGSRTRIWLGSYDSAEKAARAYDAALYCLHGSRGRFNFPEDRRPCFSEEQRKGLSKSDIKAIAARFARSSPPSAPAIPAPPLPSLDVECFPFLVEELFVEETLGAWSFGDVGQ